LLSLISISSMIVYTAEAVSPFRCFLGMMELLLL
jgi:hypothetical protein